MTQEQLLQSRAKVITDLEKEIIELKHQNERLDDQLCDQIEFYANHLKTSYEDRNSYMKRAFWMGFIGGAFIATAIMSFFL